MVAAARDFLYASTYYLEYDRYGIEFLDALDEACRRGVAVHLLLDGFGQTLGGVLMADEAKRALSSRLDTLRQAGATVTVYRPRFPIQRRLGGGQHVKIQVSEAGEAIQIRSLEIQPRHRHKIQCLDAGSDTVRP